MNPTDELANVLFKKPLRDYRVDELQELVQQYPYFGPAHLLLTKKLQQENSSAYGAELQNTSLYFQNRAWLNFLVSDNGSANAVVEKKQLAVTAEQSDHPTALIESPKEDIPVPAVVEQPAVEHIQSVEAPTAEPEPAKSTFETESKEAGAPIPLKEEETIAPIEAPSLKVDADTPGKELLFEPYHTVDYFASQGIKFKEEEKPKDRFSVQLKSFTEWLKTMKRIPVADIMVKTDPGSEKRVAQMAEYSLSERDVVTEAMAEVWKKQGNKAKAEDIYNKLSLLDPSKSSYFAAKIEELKKTS